jgi:hypothetical protein
MVLMVKVKLYFRIESMAQEHYRFYITYSACNYRKYNYSPASSSL